MIHKFNGIVKATFHIQADRVDIQSLWTLVLLGDRIHTVSITVHHSQSATHLHSTCDEENGGGDDVVCTC